MFREELLFFYLCGPCTGVFVLRSEHASFDITDVTETPDFLSFARDWSFFGTSECTTATEASLVRANTAY